MRIKLKFLVRRKMKRWSEGKGPLNKEQLDCLDKHVKEEFLRRFWTNGPGYLFTGKYWNLTKIREDNTNGD